MTDFAGMQFILDATQPENQAADDLLFFVHEVGHPPFCD